MGSGAIQRAVQGMVVVAAISAAAGAAPSKREAWLEVVYRARPLVERMGVEPGATVAVFGLSDVAFLRPVFEIVGPSGAVFTVDRNRSRFEQFRPVGREAFGDRLRPVFALDGDAHLREGSLDTVLLIDRDGFFRYERSLYAQAARALRPGGRLVVLRLREEELSPNAVTATVPKRQEHAYRLEANRNTFLVLGEGFRLVEENLDLLRYRSLRIYVREGGSEQDVSSGPTEPSGGSAPPERTPPRSPGGDSP